MKYLECVIAAGQETRMLDSDDAGTCTKARRLAAVKLSPAHEVVPWTCALRYVHLLRRLKCAWLPPGTVHVISRSAAE
jgi:hypothetical protein